ncbi:S-layer homology domain-containing protein [Bacillus horti]|uniref:SLH domain-containing protein n=2 Tax=Caldalkalibacillus horti TaxID=77523 RepID=A0ABT9VUR8_9BACI|nr:S-layer homology domain-containing protein [Bacillus horti]MDQ0164737.1 hypothetical protein [Bacillus horti]
MKRLWMLALALVLVFTLGQSAWAFTDTQNDPHAEQIKALKEAGILSGEADGLFHPNKKLTYAAGISAIVKALDLSLESETFNTVPKASDSYTNLSDQAWYAEAFIIARLNGIEVPRDVSPDDELTREQFIHYLYQGINATGQYGYTKMYFFIADEAEFTENFMGGIQNLLNARFDLLDQEGRFYPQASVTRSDAASWLYQARQFVQQHDEAAQEEPVVESPLADLALEEKSINSSVKQVTVTATAPHPGYGIKIKSITFDGEQAIIHTETIMPEEGMAYPQVITEVSASTFIDASYKPVLADKSRNIKSLR